jgi:hypothetical protein
MARGYPTHIQRAFDELRFGDGRTLNLRQWLPTADEARAWVERWLRAKQVERAGDVLVITGRGNQSEGGIPAVRPAVLALFPSLRRRNVITAWQEHTPGSFVVTLAPISALFETAKRRREPVPPRPNNPTALAGLAPETLALLRRLAVSSLAVLGIYDTDRFLESEMLAKFAALSAAIDEVDDRDAALCAAIRHALDELDDLQ